MLSTPNEVTVLLARITIEREKAFNSHYDNHYNLFIVHSFADNSSEHGDQYLRKCESAAQAQRLVQMKLINRGAINAVPNQIRCNYDGTYAEIIIENPL